MVFVWCCRDDTVCCLLKVERIYFVEDVPNLENNYYCTTWLPCLFVLVDAGESIKPLGAGSF